jgi:diaminopimelate epimerase
MKFTKVQGAGNDFVLIEGDEVGRNWTALTPVICDRHFGVGADGLLLVLPSKAVDLKMRVFNLDGSEADACGNGLRCVVRYALEKQIVKPGKQQIAIETMAGVRQVLLNNDNKPTIYVYMGKPILKAAEIPVSVSQDCTPNMQTVIKYPLTVEGMKLSLSFVSMGNPHAVYFFDGAVNDFPLSQVGPKVETHKIFPKKVNFEVAQLINRKQIEARVWERGVGETLACGSGACAIAVIARLNGEIEDKVDIMLPGGELSVHWDGFGEVLLGGPAEIVFSGDWPL